MDIFGWLKRLVSGTVGVVVITVGIFICGALSAFVLSPQAAVEWRHIQSLPVLDSAGYSALNIGAEAAITGTLQGNQTITPQGLVAYEKAVWRVTRSSSSSGTPSEPSGTWETSETNIPALKVAIIGGTVTTLPVTSANLGGSMHITIQPGPQGNLMAQYEGQDLADGATRIQGFANSDLVTLVGHKGSTGGLIPDRLFGGDRVQLVDSIREQAQTLFAVGIGMMVCAPIFLALGLFGVLTGRTRTALRLG